MWEAISARARAVSSAARKRRGVGNPTGPGSLEGPRLFLCYHGFATRPASDPFPIGGLQLSENKSFGRCALFRIRFWAFENYQTNLLQQVRESHIFNSHRHLRIN
jgi:hypothetical protein